MAKKRVYTDADRTAWVLSEGPLWKRAVRRILSTWYNHVAQFVPWSDASVPNFLAWVMKVVATCAIVGIPIWLQLKQGPQAAHKGELAVIAIVVLASVYLWGYESFLRSFVTGRAKKAQQATVTFEIASCVRSFGEIISLSESEIDQLKAKVIREKLVKCIKLASKQAMHVANDLWEVHLFTFADQQGTKMAVTEPADAQYQGFFGDFDAKDTFPYCVAVYAKTKTINDTRWRHPFRMPPGLVFRSKLAIPLFALEANQRVALGVITISSSRPYHFWSSKGKSLELILEPYLAFLKLVLKSTPNRIKVLSQ